MPHPRTRSRTRRFSACHRHPREPVTGFCALCLRDRLAGLDSSGDVSSSAPVPEFRRSKSVAGEKCEVLNDVVITDLRRKSCDVRNRNTLSDLFGVDDTKRVSVNLGFTNIEEVDGDEIRHSDDEVRGSDDVIMRDEVDDDEFEEGDLKTMKEIIDNELENKRRNFWDAASVFSHKLWKWRQKQKEKKQNRRVDGGNGDNRIRLGQFSQFGDGDNRSEIEDYRLGRRSCDTEPRFSIDAHRLSVEDPRFSFDEHRASWDGYMIARTIPRLTPMLSTVDNMLLAPVNRGSTIGMEKQMHPISEDGASSGGSGPSVSDSSTSNRGSSTSSLKSSSTKTVGSGGGDDVKSASNARVSPTNDVIFQGTKLVITEKELKDWHLNSIKNNGNNEAVSNGPNLTSKSTVTTPSNGHKMAVSSRWKKVCNLWGHKHKLNDKKSLEDIPENRYEIGNLGATHVRTPSLMNSRMLDRTRSSRYSTSDIDSGLLKLYLTPFRNSRRNKPGRSRAPLMATSGLQLN